MPEIYWPCDISRVTEWPGGLSDLRPGVHKGTDFGFAQGTELPATMAGTIKVWRLNVASGWGIDIIDPSGFRVRNWHMSRIDVTDGQRVEVGDIIGLTGGGKGTPGAGNSTGPHLHWELRTNSGWGDGWIDPRNMNPQPGNLADAKKPKTEMEPLPMKLYRNKDTNEVAAISMDTGNVWVVPNYDYLLLVQGWHLFENDEPISLPDNVYNLVKGIASGAPCAKTSHAGGNSGTGASIGEIEKLIKSVSYKAS